MQIGGNQQVVEVAQQTAGVAATTTAATTSKSPVDQAIDAVGGAQALTDNAVALVEIQSLEAKVKALKKKVDPYIKNLQSQCDALNVPVGTVITAPNGTTLTYEEKTVNRKDIVDKAALYAFFEKAQPGQFFQLCTIPMGDVEKYVPAEKFASAGIKINPTTTKTIKVESPKK